MINVEAGSRERHAAELNNDYLHHTPTPHQSHGHLLTTVYSPSDMRPPVYSTPACQPQRCREELIYSRRTADVSTYHECHHRSELERSLLQARKPGTDCLQPIDLLTVSLVSSVNSKLYFSWRRTVSVNN